MKKPKLTRFNFELPIELRKKANNKAIKEGMTLSFLLRKLLRDCLQEEN